MTVFDATQVATLLGQPLMAIQQEQLQKFSALLLRWNKVYNLTAIKTPQEVFTKHILDSLTVSSHLTAHETIADIGTGAGLPGIPLAIVHPRQQFFLVESQQKRIVFLTYAKSYLGLHNITILQARVEHLDHTCFDVLVSRAFATLTDFVNMTTHLGTQETTWIAMKGKISAEEKSALPTGFVITAEHPVAVPGADFHRCLITMKKQRRS